MESKTVVTEDYCCAWQANYLEIPKHEKASDGHHYFYIQFEVEFFYPSAVPAEDDDYLLVFPDLECIKTFQGFWVPCKRLKQDNLSWDEISKMLSQLKVPLHKQPFVLNRIAARADEMANANRNKNKKVLPMMVSITIVVDYCSDDQEDESTVAVKESEEVYKLMPVPATKESVKAPVKKKVTKLEIRSEKQCMICMKEFEVGSETRRLPCSHVYHEACIVTWLRLCNFCIVCHSQLPAAN